MTTQTVVALAKLGFQASEINTLGKVARAFHRWDERECGNERGCVWRRDDGKPVWQNAMTGDEYPVRDAEAAAQRRLDRVMKDHPSLVAYHQSDCRGCALYILTQAQINGSDIHSVYNLGVAVC